MKMARRKRSMLQFLHTWTTIALIIALVAVGIMNQGTQFPAVLTSPLATGPRKEQMAFIITEPAAPADFL